MDFVTAEFVVERTGDTSQELVVFYAVSAADGGGTPYREGTTSADIEEKTGTLTFAAGSRQRQTISVKIKDDDVYEPWERYMVTLSLTDGGPAVDTAYGRITEDDKRSLTFATAIRVKEGMPQQALKIELDKPLPYDLSVEYEVVRSRHLTSTETIGDGGATMADHKLVGSEGTCNPNVKIPKGSLSAAIDIPIVDDRVPEPDEQFRLLVAACRHQTLDGSYYPSVGEGKIVTITIEDDDVPGANRYVYLQGGSESIMGTQEWVDEGKSVPVTATLVGVAPTTDVRIPLKFTGFPSAEVTTADYTIPGFITIQAGKKSGSVTLAVRDDSTDERHRELLAIEINDGHDDWPSGYVKGDRSRFEVIMKDVQGLGVQLRSLGKSSLSEGAADKQVTFEIHMDRLPKGAPTGTAPFSDIELEEGQAPEFALSYGGGAARGADYESVNSVSAGTGNTDCQRGTGITCTVTLTVKDDDLYEHDEKVTIALNPDGSKIENGGGFTKKGSDLSLTIEDNDVQPMLSIEDVEVREGGSAGFKVKRASGAKENSISVQAATARDGRMGQTPATAGSDYGAKSGTLTLGRNVTQTIFTVATTDDMLDEPDETFQVSLSNPRDTQGNPAPGISDGEAIGTIEDGDDPPSFSIAGGEADEGEDVVFTVTRSGATGNAATVKVATAADTDDDANPAAVADYEAISPARTLSFPGGTTSVTVEVEAKDDDLYEPDDETFLAVISGAALADGDPGTGVGIAADGGSAKGTIMDTDEQPSFSVAAASATEGVAVTFTVTRSGASGNAVSVHWKTKADAGEGVNSASSADYTAVTTVQRLDFAAGITAVTFTVATTGDALDEPDETFRVELTAAGGGARIATAEAIGTITDDDDPPTVSVGDAAAVAEGDDSSKTTAMTFTVRLSAASGRTVTVPYTLGGTATAPADYTAPVSLTVTIAPGGTSATIAIPVKGDVLDEPDETVTVTLGASTHATVSTAEDAGTGSGTITDDDATPSFSIADASGSEGDAITFTATRSGAVDNVVSVQWTTAADSGQGVVAAGAGDYTAVSTARTLDFAAGVTARTLTVATTEDTLDEPAETFRVVLSRPAKGASDPGGTPTITAGTAVGTIIDDDDPPTASVGDAAAVDEGDDSSKTTDMTFTVRLSGASGRTVTVPYTLDGTADGGDDYTAPASRTVTIAPGDTSASIAIPVKGDVLDEPDETVTVTLETPTHATLSTADGADTGSGTITDDDAPAVLSIRSTFGDEGDSGTTNLTFAVTLTPVSGQTVTVKYADAGSGTATPGAGGDYAALSSGTISFSPGETRKRIRVKVNGDTDYEPEETVIVRLSGASNATLSGGESTLDGIGYIENDDAPPLPRIAPGDVTVEEGKTATFTVTRSHDFEPVTVSYGTSPGSDTSTHDAATSGTDYVPYSADSTETFAIGEKSIELDFETEDDKLHEAPEDFTVAISGTGYSETFVVTIIDNDPVPTATLALTDSSIREADGRSRVTASLDRPTSRDLRLAVNATPKSDHAGTGDIKRTGQRLTIPAGATASTGIVALTGIDNKVDAPDKVFTVSAILFGNADIDDPADVTLTITDDDDPPTVSVGDAAAVDEGDDSSKTTDMTFTVRLSGASGRTVTVPYTLDGTATAPADYTAPVSLTVTIAPGDTSASIAIPVKGDEIDEPDETVTVTLGTPTHATLSTAKGAGTGSGTITDNDERGITVAGGPLTL
ncbi:MAG: hypothetical protein OXN23_06380, partial [Gammaproteobacteria bacterium]|nr:hypothetical protein [Gammaproteobacteria bacterium]